LKAGIIDCGIMGNAARFGLALTGGATEGVPV
jgi:hypothetical protein